jgi:hypothetical protein
MVSLFPKQQDSLGERGWGVLLHSRAISHLNRQIEMAKDEK